MGMHGRAGLQTCRFGPLRGPQKLMKAPKIAILYFQWVRRAFVPARDVHVPLFRTLESAVATEQQADVDVGRKPGGLPHQEN